MKVAFVLLACLGLAAAASFHSTNEVQIADTAFLQNQKFLLEIVYRVEDPLLFEQWINFGNNLIVDASHYTNFEIRMEQFVESMNMGVLLPRGEFFGAFVKTHHQQAWGLFNFFYFAKDFETFQHNVCWARMHVNEGMFVYALNLAVIHRQDLQGLILPTIHELLPQHFFNSKFIYEAEKFDFNVFNRMIMYEKEFYDVFYKNNQLYDNDYVYIKDWKVWQWWKLMGLAEHWYKVDNFIVRENIYEFNQDPKWNNMMKELKMVWMPVDYSRDVEIFNEHSQISYFTEDVGFNTWWYYFNLDYSYFLDGQTFGLAKDRRGEYWVHVVNQVLGRYYMERLSNNMGEIPEFSWYTQIEQGYDPELISYNGVGFSYRKNYWEVQTFGNMEMLNVITNAFQRIQNIVSNGFYKTRDGQTIDLTKPESIEFIGNMLQGNVDTIDNFFFTYWYLLSQMYFADAYYHDMDVYPNVMLNFETMLRDPLFYIFHKQISNVFFNFKNNLQPYTNEELYLPGVEIKDVQMDKLVTYFDIVDHDVTNLLNDKMVFDNGQFYWNKSLFARQMHLNHQPFTYTLNVQSAKQQKVVVRTFMAPKYDEFGSLISLTENRQNFIEIDEFLYTLNAGNNNIQRNSNDFYWTVKDRTTYTELYQYVMLAYDGKYDFPLDISEPHCGFPDRLLLPKGWGSGFPVQFFFMITPYTMSGNNEQFSTYDYTYSCGIGSGVRHIDNMPFGYPFDRPIDEYEFVVPNMYFQDVNIYHVDNFVSYQHNYSNYGKFDYTFMNNYWTKSFKH